MTGDALQKRVKPVLYKALELLFAFQLIALGHGAFGPVRLAATTGFLCWQTDNGRQNDAVQYGFGAFLTLGDLRASAEWAGYTGWERHGDSPQTLKSRLSYRFGQYEPYVFIQHGLHDWPFTQLRFGVLYRW